MSSRKRHKKENPPEPERPTADIRDIEPVLGEPPEVESSDEPLTDEEMAAEDR